MLSHVPASSGTYREITAALAERLISERKTADFFDLVASPIEILIPSRGVADAIVGALTRAFPEGVAGIRLQTLETLAIRVVNEAGRFPRVAGEADRRLAMLTAAAQIKEERLNTPGIAVMLERSYRDIRDSGVTLSAFRRKRDSFIDPQRAAELMDCWRRYESTLARAGAIDPADLVHQAVEVLGNSNIPPQIVFGFYDMTGIQEIFLSALHRAALVDSIYVPIPEGERREERGAKSDPPPSSLLTPPSSLLAPRSSPYTFASRHLQEVKKIATMVPLSRPPGPDLSWLVRNHATPSDEARETCRTIRALIDGGSDPRRIGIAARRLEPELVGAMERAAAEFDLALSRPAGRPLSSHPFGRAMRMLLELRELRFPRAMVVELAGAPLRRDFWGFSFQAERLDFATRRAEIAGGPSTWVKTTLRRVEIEHPRDLEHVTNYIRVLDRLERFTEPLTTSRRGARWNETIEALCDAFVIDTEQDLLAIEALREMASVCRRADPASFDAIALLHLIATADPLPSPPRPLAPSPSRTIWFGDVMKARGRSFEHLFLLDCRDGAFPQARSEDPLVPNADRKLAGVRQIADGRDEERLLFQLLVDSVERQIHLSYSTSDGIRRVFYASQFMKDLAQSREPDPNLRRLAIRNFTDYLAAKTAATPPSAFTRAERRIANLRSDSPRLTPELIRKLDMVRLAGTRSRFDSYLSLSEAFERALGEKLQLISPTRLEYYGQCPQRFLFTTVLGIGEIEDPEYELQISLRKKGGLDHKILERFYGALTEDDYRLFDPVSGKLPEKLQRQLDGAIAEEFRRHEADFPAPNQMIREIEQKLTRRFLSDFVREDLRDLMASGLRPRYFEYQFGPGRGEKEPDHDAVTLRLGSRAVTLRGKMDRVDHQSAAGRYRIVDYKSGKGERYKDVGKLITDGTALQLGFYALAAASIFGVSPSQIEAAIKPLRRGDADERFSFKLADIHEILEETVSRLGESMSAGQFPAFPGRHCEYCAVNRWCRSKHDEQEKHALQKYGSALQFLRAVVREEEPA